MTTTALNSPKKSNKTTIAGFFIALAAIITAIFHMVDQDPNTTVSWPKVIESAAIVAAGLGALYGFWKTRDHDVSSRDAGLEPAIEPTPPTPSSSTETRRIPFDNLRNLVLACFWIGLVATVAGCCQCEEKYDPLVRSHEVLTTRNRDDHLRRIQHDERLTNEQREQALQVWSDNYEAAAAVRAEYDSQ
jgi:hypothetical protein